MIFKFNKSGELDPEFTKVNPFFFSYQFEGSHSYGEEYREVFYLLDLYGTRYHYEKDFGRDGKDLLAGIYGSRVYLNRNIGVIGLKEVLNNSKKEFTDLPQAYTLGDFDFNALSASIFEIKTGLPIYYSPPWHKHLNLSIWFYNEFYNFYQECLLWAEVDRFGKAANIGLFNHEFEHLRSYCKMVFEIELVFG